MSDSSVTAFKKELELCMNARYPVVYIVTWEEERAERVLSDVLQVKGKRLFVWSVSSGFQPDGGALTAPLDALDHVADSPDRAVFVLKDLHPYLDDPRVVRKVRDVIGVLRKSRKTLIILSPVMRVPVELEKDIVVMDLPLPDSEDLRVLLRGYLKSLSNSRGVSVEGGEDLIERTVKAALGLTYWQAKNVFSKAIVDDKRFSVDDLPLIISEKKQILRQSGLLEYYDLSESMAEVGGVAGLKRWLQERSDAFSDRARQYGLPEPKGLLLLGVQGCGKSLTAKAIASEWKLPLLRLDVGSVFSGLLGSSEENMRRSLKISESLAPCVLWLDEVEKGLSGLEGSGASDGGVTARIIGTFLTWLQEKTKPVFVVATANSVQGLPPELLRKGRFDEIFFVDLPEDAERNVIFEIHLAKRNRHLKKFDTPKLASLSRGFSGAEIEQGIVSAMYTAFGAKREFTTEDIGSALQATVPLSRTRSEEVDYLRNWASERARSASR